MVTRTRQGERRWSPRLYRLLLTAHVAVAVGWLGVALAKLVLGFAAVTASALDVAAALLLSTRVINVAFPPLAIATIVTGVLLSLGTRWGLLRHYWVMTKLVLTVAVIVSAVQLSDRLVRQVNAAPDGPAVPDDPLLALLTAPMTLAIALSVTHVLMLGVATVLSFYKPWGTTWFSRRAVVQASRSATHEAPTTS